MLGNLFPNPTNTPRRDLAAILGIDGRTASRASELVKPLAEASSNARFPDCKVGQAISALQLIVPTPEGFEQEKADARLQPMD